MLLKIKADTGKIVIANLNESELKKMDNIFILEKGVNKLVYDIKFRCELAKQYGVNDILYLAIPEKVTQDFYTVSLLTSKLKIDVPREEVYDDIDLEVLILKGGKDE